jgi:hypothetical protein
MRAIVRYSAVRDSIDKAQASARTRTPRASGIVANARTVPQPSV